MGESYVPRPRDFELGLRSDILSPVTMKDGRKTGSNALLDSFAVTSAFQGEGIDEEEHLWVEALKQAVTLLRKLGS